MESSRANLPSVDTDVEPARFKCRVKVDHAVSISCACLLDQFCWTGFEEYMNFFQAISKSLMELIPDALMALVLVKPWAGI